MVFRCTGIFSLGRIDMKCLFLLFASVFVVTGCKNNQPGKESVPYRNWESSSVKSHHIRIHYWRTGGTGKPVMIMAHGITDYGLVFASLAGRLEDDYDIIMYDARGHGFSSKPEGPYDLATHVEDLMGLIKALDIEHPILMGHSMGSGIVSLFGATYPDIPQAIILEDPALAGEIDYLTEAVLPEWKQRIEADRSMGKQKLIKEGKTKRHKGWSDFEYDHWAEAKLLVHANVVEVIVGKALANEDKIYPKISAPVLILKADAGRETREKHLKAASDLANGTIVHIDGATHQVRLDKPDETEHQIRRFLAGLNRDSHE